MNNLEELLKKLNVAEIEKKREAMKKKLSQTFTEASSGGGVVRTKMDGNGKLVSLEIDDTLLDTNNKTSLQDLIIASININKEKVTEATQNIAMENMMESLPGLLKNLTF